MGEYGVTIRNVGLLRHHCMDEYLIPDTRLLRKKVRDGVNNSGVGPFQFIECRTISNSYHHSRVHNYQRRLRDQPAARSTTRHESHGCRRCRHARLCRLCLRFSRRGHRFFPESARPNSHPWVSGYDGLPPASTIKLTFGRYLFYSTSAFPSTLPFDTTASSSFLSALSSYISSQSVAATSPLTPPPTPPPNPTAPPAPSVSVATPTTATSSPTSTSPSGTSSSGTTGAAAGKNLDGMSLIASVVLGMVVTLL
ncbi:hypothetical protein EDD16DRAFT_241307 [Pisolithus croceorrhizus]|nr:hypothetical protein EDD16DRAFT_241307 [Pisolithus croceorrhizus]